MPFQVRSMRVHLLAASLLVLAMVVQVPAGTVELAGASLSVAIDDATGQWALLDKQSGTRWPSEGKAGPGSASWLSGRFARADVSQSDSVRLVQDDGGAVVFALVQAGRALEIRYESQADDPIRVLGDALAITDTEGGYAIVPSREGLLIPADSARPSNAPSAPRITRGVT